MQMVTYRTLVGTDQAKLSGFSCNGLVLAWRQTLELESVHGRLRARVHDVGVDTAIASKTRHGDGDR